MLLNLLSRALSLSLQPALGLLESCSIFLINLAAIQSFNGTIFLFFFFLTKCPLQQRSTIDQISPRLILARFRFSKFFSQINEQYATIFFEIFDPRNSLYSRSLLHPNYFSRNPNNGKWYGKTDLLVEERRERIGRRDPMGPISGQCLSRSTAKCPKATISKLREYPTISNLAEEARQDFAETSFATVPSFYSRPSRRLRNQCRKILGQNFFHLPSQLFTSRIFNLIEFRTIYYCSSNKYACESFSLYQTV